MTIWDALTLVGAIAASLGGAAAVVIALSGWLGNLWAKRILQHEQSKLQAQLEELRHELSLEKSSYERYLELILEYYTLFYRHYRMCQRTARADAHRRLPNGEITETKDEFLAKLSGFIGEWNVQEGKIRLLLPSRILEIHSEAITCFNRFKRTVDEFESSDEARRKKEEAFQAVEDVKNRLEAGLRDFLRTEKLLK